MEITAKRTAFFPGERAELSLSGAPDEVRWSGGGEPSSGRGRRFVTTFAAGGTYRIRAEGPLDTAHIDITVCPVDRWLARAKDFFGPSLDVTVVQVKASRWVFGSSTSGWTCNTVIRFRRPIREEDLPKEATLIHELGHVWEHRSGQMQLLSGLVEQVGRLFRGDPYDYGGPSALRDATTLRGFSKESQAQIMTELWKSEHGYTADRKDVPFSTEGYVDDLRRLVQGAGIGTTDATRRTFPGRIDSAVARFVNAVLARLD
jgi:hypothetical protein